MSKQTDLRRIYHVVDKNGNLAGHDLDYQTAEQCLAEMQRQEPDGEWEIINESEE